MRVVVVLTLKQSDVMLNAIRIVGGESSLPREVIHAASAVQALAWTCTNYGYESVAPFEEHISELSGMNVSNEFVTTELRAGLPEETLSKKRHSQRGTLKKE